MRAPRGRAESGSAPGRGKLDYRLVAGMLAPLLLLQGIGVRRRTPRLPEPPGPRAGELGAGPPLRILIAGDSAAAGVGAASQAEGLAGRVTTALAGDFEVRWQLSAQTGLRTRQLGVRLAASPASRFDVALLSAGVNDVTGGTRSVAFLAAQRELLALLRSRFGVGYILLTGLPPMHAFPALPQPLRWVLGERARHFTALLEILAAGETGCELLVPPLPIDLAYMAADGFHPGPLAYEVWGREAAARIGRWRRTIR
jgi:lysophospholipase L1-like esterase